MARKTWDQYFLDLARAAAQRSTCPRLRVGAVVVKSNKVIATGFNGAPRGQPHCDDVGCLMKNDHCIRAVHGDANALIFSGEKSIGATLYITHAPCWSCAGLIINAGIARIVYAQDYGGEDGPERLRKAGIK